jgi:response regulator of citrate/malate metabolism
VIRTLIVDDDPRVAGMHAGFVAEIPGFEVVGVARTAAEARIKVRELRPDLLLADIYLPDQPGLTLLTELGIDTVVLTAASDARTVRAAIRAGALHYLIKPLTQGQLADRLTGYARYRELLHTQAGLAQTDVDRAYRLLHDQDRTMTARGRSPATLRLVSDRLRAERVPLSAAEVATTLGIARATAQRYLTALADSGAARMRLRYGLTGRPEHEYLWTGER